MNRHNMVFWKATWQKFNLIITPSWMKLKNIESYSSFLCLFTSWRTLPLPFFCMCAGCFSIIGWETTPNIFRILFSKTRAMYNSFPLIIVTNELPSYEILLNFWIECTRKVLFWKSIQELWTLKYLYQSIKASNLNFCHDLFELISGRRANKECVSWS